MKKIISIIVVVMLSISIFGCTNTITTQTIENEKKLKFGQLSFAGVTAEEFNKKIKSLTAENNISIEFFDDLTSMLASLDSGKVDRIILPSVAANYLTNKNNTYEILQTSSDVKKGVATFAMLLKEGNEELRDRINKSIIEGRATQKRKTIIDDMGNTDTVEFEKFEGAETITFAVTGDMPPMDYVDENGNASGFNVKLIAEICKEMGVNAEIIQINSGARAMALSTGKADVVFWTKGQIDDYCINLAKEVSSNETSGEMHEGIKSIFNTDGSINNDMIKYNNEINKLDMPAHTICTTPYFVDAMVDVIKK